MVKKIMMKQALQILTHKGRLMANLPAYRRQEAAFPAKK